jgi:hypothetical protein
VKHLLNKNRQKQKRLQVLKQLPLKRQDNIHKIVLELVV